MTDAKPRDEIARLRELIDAGERGGSDSDREVLLEASDHMDLVPSQIGPFRHLKILRHATRMAEEVGGLAKATEDKDAAEDIVRWIHREYSNEHTNQDYRTALRSIGRYALQSDEPPESLAWIPTGTSNDFDPTPSERDMLLYEEEVVPMIESAKNTRDAALIAVQFEAGLRGGELYDLRIGDVFDSEHAVGLHVDGKEGERTVHLIVSTPYLQRWLEDHPAQNKPDAWLWSKLNTAERPSYVSFLNYFKRAADRVGVSKEVTPTNFRKSNTRWLVILGWNQARIEDRQGRKRGSEHTARYLARFGEESNERAYATLHGLEVEQEESDVARPVPCPRCKRETPADRDFCMWCHYAMSFEATEKLEDTINTGVDKMVDAEEEVAREMFGEFVKFISENPHRLSDGAQAALTSAMEEDSSSSSSSSS